MAMNSQKLDEIKNQFDQFTAKKEVDFDNTFIGNDWKSVDR